MARLTMINLDDETAEIWKKIPCQQRSATVREFLRTLNKDQPQDPQQTCSVFSQASDEYKGLEKTSNAPEVNLSEMAATVRNGQRSSSRKRKESIAEQLWNP